MSKYFNPGKVNLKKAEQSIVAAGGARKTVKKDGFEHVVTYSRNENRHLSYDVYPDGRVDGVHTDKNNAGYITYGGSK